jgi:nucleoside-diphosphate-sugar epimerase
MIFDWIRRGKPVFLLGQGTSRYQLLDIRDMAEGIRLLAASDALGVFFFGARRFGTLRDDLQSLVASAGTGSPLRSIPGPIARLGIRAVEVAGMVPLSELHSMSAWNTDSVVDISRAVQELGWVPRWSNAEALESSYKWYVQSMASTGSAPTIHALPEGHKLAGRLIELVSSVVSHK